MTTQATAAPSPGAQPGAPSQSPNLATALGTEGATGTPPAGAPTGGEPAQKQESASQAFQLIAKEKKRVMEMKAQAAAREKELADREARLKDQEGRYSQKPNDPIAALQAAGFSYEDATQFVLNNQQLTPEQRMKQFEERVEGRFKAQEDEKAKRAEAEAEAAKKAHAEAVEEFQGRIWDQVNSDPVKYELSNLEDPGDIKALGFQLADLHFQQHKKVLSETEVADLVEGYLEEKAGKLAQAKKLQAKFKPAEPAPTDETKAPPKTLASAITSSSTPTYSPAKSEAERIQRAKEALERMGR